jgi:hypothetical protein
MQCVIFCRILTKLRNWSTDLTKIPISNFRKIRPVEAELFHADRRTDMRKLIVAVLTVLQLCLLSEFGIYLC